MSRIVLAVDGSEHATRAALTAGRLSAALDAPVDVINVVSDMSPVTPAVIHEYAEIERITITQRDLLESIGADVVAEAAAIVREADGEIHETRVLIGSPARQIVDYADREDADLIVMGRRGIGDIAGLFMGSVSHKVGHLTERTLVTTE